MHIFQIYLHLYNQVIKKNQHTEYVVEYIHYYQKYYQLKYMDIFPLSI